MHDRASRQLDGADGVSIALAPYLDQFDRRPVSGIAYLAFLAMMRLTGVAIPCHTRPTSKTRQAVAVTVGFLICTYECRGRGWGWGGHVAFLADRDQAMAIDELQEHRQVRVVHGLSACT